MQCNCGGEMVKRNVVRKKEVVGSFFQCKKKIPGGYSGCGRVEKSKLLIEYLKTHGDEGLKDESAK